MINSTQRKLDFNEALSRNQVTKCSLVNWERNTKYYLISGSSYVIKTKRRLRNNCQTRYYYAKYVLSKQSRLLCTSTKYINNILYLPAPHRPEGRLPVCIQSFFILWTSLDAVVATSWVFLSKFNWWANLNIYKLGSKM